MTTIETRQQGEFFPTGLALNRLMCFCLRQSSGACLFGPRFWGPGGFYSGMMLAGFWDKKRQEMCTEKMRRAPENISDSKSGSLRNEKYPPLPLPPPQTTRRCDPRDGPVRVAAQGRGIFSAAAPVGIEHWIQAVWGKGGPGAVPTEGRGFHG